MKATRNIRVGIVGFGLAGRVFHAPLVSSVDGLELVAVVERTTNHAAARYPGVSIYRTLDDMLRDSSVDLVVAATPSGAHYEVARKVLEAGKPVIVDKPMCSSSDQISDLANFARSRNLALIPFHNRRWDGDFLTIQKLLSEGMLGQLVYFESRMDRWSPGLTRVAWKDDAAAGGGVLLDLGTHLVDQALVLFGSPLAVSAEVLRERAGGGAEDAFTIRLRYSSFRLTLAANALSLLPGPRFHLRGTRGNFIKHGVDPQESALKTTTRINALHWGEDAEAAWGVLKLDEQGDITTASIATIPGNYRLYYAAVRDALLNKSADFPVTPTEAWRVSKILEWAKLSSDSRREVSCNWP